MLLLALIVLALIFAFGASLGSFTAVLIERVPKGRSIMEPSTCACGRKLKWYENVPVFGWLRVAGRTRCCHTRIPAWYLYLELAFGFIACLFAVRVALLTITLLSLLAV